MIIYRISLNEHANLEGIGGLYSSGRWNFRGYRIIYASQSRSLAILEKIVHITRGTVIPQNTIISIIKIPDDLKIQEVPKKILIKNWNKYPYQKITMEYGTNFLKENNNLLLKIPSAIVENEFNYIINPVHKDIYKIDIIKTENLNFDNRLIK